MEQVRLEEDSVGLSAPVSSAFSYTPVGTGEEQGCGDGKGVSCDISVDKSSSRQVDNPDGDYKKTIINDATVTADHGDELLQNPFEMPKIIEIILKNMNMDDLKDARFINNIWNKTAAQVLSTPSRQAKIEHIKCYTEDTLELLKNSNNLELFQKFEFETWNSRSIYSDSDDYLFLDDDNYPEICEILELTHPTEIIFRTDDKADGIPKNSHLDVDLISEFFHQISQHVVHLKIHFSASKDLLFDDNDDTLEFEFPKLKTLELEVNGFKGTMKFIKMVLKNCHSLENLKVYGVLFKDNERKKAIDKILPHLITSQNLSKLHLGGMSFKFGQLLLNPFTYSGIVMRLKSFTIDTLEIYPDKTLFTQEFRSFLTSQRKYLKELAIRFTISGDLSFDEIELAARNQNRAGFSSMLDLPRLGILEILKLNYEWFTDVNQYWPVTPINLPETFPKKKIEISYHSRWQMSFMIAQPSETVEELILDKWATWNNFSIQDFISIFPKVKYFKVVFDFYKQDHTIVPKFSSIEGWASTLKMIDIQYGKCFPQNFNFQPFSALSNLEHLYLHQEKERQNEVSIRPDFTPLFNMEKLSKLVIDYIKISDDIIKVLFERFPNFDYTIDTEDYLDYGVPYI